MNATAVVLLVDQMLNLALRLVGIVRSLPDTDEVARDKLAGLEARLSDTLAAVAAYQPKEV